MMPNSFLKAIALPAKCRSIGVFLRPGPLGGKVFSCMLLLILLSIPAIALDAKQDVGKDADQAKKAVEAPIRYSGILYKSDHRRDPFLNPLLIKKDPNKPQEDEEISRGLPPPGIAGTYIAQALLQGISISADGRIAVVRGADTRAYFLREGDRLFDGYLKTIDNDCITLVRETKLRSGKTLTQDVTKRLRTP